MDSFSVPITQCHELHVCVVTREEFLAVEKKLSSVTRRATCFVVIISAFIALLLVTAGVTGVHVFITGQPRSRGSCDVSHNQGDGSSLPVLSQFDPGSGLSAEQKGHDYQATISFPAAQYSGTGTKNLTDPTFNPYKYIGAEPLNIFTTASWKGDKASPFIQHPHFFQAKSSGIHLVFAQIVFSKNDNVKSASIIQEREEVSIDSLNCYTGSFGEVTKKQTCTIVGLLNIQRGDVIKLISNNKYAAVLRADGDTYFGVVQLFHEHETK